MNIVTFSTRLCKSEILFLKEFPIPSNACTIYAMNISLKYTLCGIIILALNSCTGGTTPNAQESDPGTVTLHRLNKTELNNTWRDLLGTDLRPADEFPSDDLALGFDNIADSLSTSPLHFEMLEAATESLLSTEVLPIPIRPIHLIGEAESDDTTSIATSAGGTCCNGEAHNLWSRGQVEFFIELPQDGVYSFKTAVWGDQAGPEPVRMAIGLDNVAIDFFDITAANQAETETIEVTAEASKGFHSFYVEFTNDYYEPETGEDRNLKVDYLEVKGPIDANDALPKNYANLFTCDESQDGETSCAESIANTFGARAWRRPVTQEESQRLLSLYEDQRAAGSSYTDAVGVLAKAILLSPHFYYRVEMDSTPNDTTSHPLTSWELATRMSYFIWSSMPDTELFAAAADDSLLDEEVMRAQTKRMLADPKAMALVDNFAGQWLQIRAVDDVFPDVWYFPDWDESLRASMKEELHRLATNLLMQDRSMLDLLTFEETELNAQLAAHYGIALKTNDVWQTVSLEDTERMGWLTTAGLLTLTSYPTRTSPVQRGKWVLSNLLCETPPPPPDNVDTILEEEEVEEGESLVEQLARHREDPVCASCHQSMDPIGLGLENFDGIGAWRDVDEVGNTIEPAGQLTDGFSFSTPRELAQHIAQDPKFSRCITMKAMTYGLGRAPEATDWPYLETLENEFSASNHRFSSLVEAIVVSEPFRTRRGREDAP